jgi:hypothetical protein
MMRQLHRKLDCLVGIRFARRLTPRRVAETATRRIVYALIIPEASRLDFRKSLKMNLQNLLAYGTMLRSLSNPPHSMTLTIMTLKLVQHMLII